MKITSPSKRRFLGFTLPEVTVSIGVTAQLAEPVIPDVEAVSVYWKSLARNVSLRLGAEP